MIVVETYQKPRILFTYVSDNTEHCPRIPTINSFSLKVKKNNLKIFFLFSMSKIR